MKIRNLKFIGLFFICFLFSCGQDVMPKPYGDLRLEYPTPQFKNYKGNCPFVFQYEEKALIKDREADCRFNIYYPQLKATIYLTYEPIKNNNLPALLQDAEKAVYLPHTEKASYIAPQIIIKEKDKVYGTLYELGGDTALNYQFHLTDSTRNFIRGALYFKAHPNPDSLAPAIDYMKGNLVHLVETFQWK